MYRCFRLSLLGTLACLVVFVSSAHADETINLSFGADATEEVPVPITVAWSSSVSSVRVHVTVKPAGGLGCAPNYAADDPNSQDVIFNAGDESTGSRSENQEFSEPGVFTLCGYLQNRLTDAVLKATGPVALTVRAAKASVALAVPARVEGGQTFTVSATVTAELQRGLFVTLKPAGGRGCEPNYAADDPNSIDQIHNASVQGAVSKSENITASQTHGIYLLCAYIQEGSSDPTPEAVASAMFAVGPDPCTTARAAQTAAQRKLASARASVTRNRKLITRYAAAVRRGKKASRRRNRSLLNAARKRHRSAQVRRSAASQSVTKRTAAVAQACR